MKNWLRKKLLQFLHGPNEPAGIEKVSRYEKLRKNSFHMAGSGIDVQSTGLESNDHNPIRFCIYNAQGGKIVEVRSYNEQTDQWTNNLYVVENNENFGDSIGKIVFMEMLRNR